MRVSPLIPRWLWWGSLAAAIIGSIGYALMSPELRGRVFRETPAAAYADARVVVDRRCVECHSRRPVHPAFPIAPKGILLDTAEEMRDHADRILARAVIERTMPLANMTGMTDEERAILARWVEAGAAVP
jgi:uncharacterized membrane protein